MMKWIIDRIKRFIIKTVIEDINRNGPTRIILHLEANDSHVVRVIREAQ